MNAIIFTLMGEYPAVSATFAALSDPTRRALLAQLMSGSARITELAVPHDISLNSVSKHVRILERAKLVSREVRGRDHWISFNSAPLADARAELDSMLTFWQRRLDSLEAFLACGLDEAEK